MNTRTETSTSRINPERSRDVRLGTLLAFLATITAALLVFPALTLAGTPTKDPLATFEGSRDYIVLYHQGVDLGASLRREVRKGNEIEDRYTSSINGALLELGADDVNRLRESEKVLAIGPNGPVSIAGAVAPSRSAPSWGLDRIDQRNLPLNGGISTVTRGSGVEAYVIDTGIKFRHQEFTGRINPEGFSSTGSRVDCNGHGTHVAGTVAGAKYGVAPAARITVVSVLDCAGGGTWADVVSGIDWMISDHRAGEPAVANLSLGGARRDGDVVNLAVERAADDGIVMVVAAGNDGDEACGYTPAFSISAITVGSVDRTDRVSSFSNYGSCVDLFAPGRGIRSASIYSNSASEVMDGTSMASPHVAGAAALLLSAEPHLTPTDVARRLRASATPNRITLVDQCSANQLLYVGSGGNLPQPTPVRPANDRFADRSDLPLSGTVEGTNECAIHEVREPGHHVTATSTWDANASIWYKWTAPASGRLTLSAAGTSFGHMMSLYTGTELRSLDRVASDSGASTFASIDTRVTGGTTYSIALDRWVWRTVAGREPTGTTRLSVGFRPDPVVANDHFRNAANVAGSFSYPGANRGATGELGETAHFGNQEPRASVWYRWTAPDSGTLTLSTAGSNFDTILAVYTGVNIGSLIQVVSDDDSGGQRTSQVTFDVLSGRTYSFAVDGYSGDTGDLRLNGEFVPASGGEPNPDDPDQPPSVNLPRPFFWNAPARRSWVRKAVFEFSGHMEPASKFVCRLDRRPWTSCRSTVRFRSLARRWHVFRVKERYGESESRPAVYRWKIVRRAR